MKDKPSAEEIRYTPRRDANPENELNALAAVYKFLLDSGARQKAAEQSGPNDVEGRSNAIHADLSIP